MFENKLIPLIPANGECTSDHIQIFFDAIKTLYYVDPLHCERVISTGKPLFNKKEKWVQRYGKAARVFFPLCENKHWHLFWIEKNERSYWELKLLDGRNGACLKRTPEEYFTIWKKLLAPYSEYFESFEHVKIPPQEENSNECGIVICYYAHRLSKGYPVLSGSQFVEEEPKKNGYLFFRATVQEIISARLMKLERREKEKKSAQQKHLSLTKKTETESVEKKLPSSIDNNLLVFSPHPRRRELYKRSCSSPGIITSSSHPKYNI